MNYNNISRHKLMVTSIKKKKKKTRQHRDNKCTMRDSTYILISKVPRLMI